MNKLQIDYDVDSTLKRLEKGNIYIAVAWEPQMAFNLDMITSAYILYESFLFAVYDQFSVTEEHERRLCDLRKLQNCLEDDNWR